MRTDRAVRPYYAIQRDNGSGSPSLGVVTFASHRKSMMAGALCASSLPADRRGSDDAIGAECWRSFDELKRPARCPDEAPGRGYCLTNITCLAATGSRAICPVSALLRAKGDA